MLKKNVGWVVLSISKKVFFYVKDWKDLVRLAKFLRLIMSDYVCHQLIVMLFLIKYIICLAYTTSFPTTKKNGQMLFIGCHLLQKGASMQTSDALKKLFNTFFFKWSKDCEIFVKQSQEAYSKMLNMMPLKFFITYNLFISFEEKKTGKVFPMN